MDKVGQYAKALVALAIGVLVVVGDALTDGEITNEEWKLVVAALVSGVLVWLVPNKPTVA